MLTHEDTVTARREAEERLQDYLVETYRMTPQSWTQIKVLVDEMVAQAVKGERADVKLMTMTVRRLAKPDTPEWREAGRILERLRSTAALRAPFGPGGDG